ncbi:MAG: hypothetical protein O6944_02905 [Gammaproteobacteria bacterium]|nr:hypothetical protein [Gammaproteobacteria bacterium]
MKAQYLEAEAQRIVNMKNDPEGAYSPDMIKAAAMRLHKRHAVTLTINCLG